MTHRTITCSSSTIGTLEKDVKYVQGLTVKTLETHYWSRSGIFIANFEHISHLFSSVYCILYFIVDFEQINVIEDE